jgi:hypothetical protein
VDILCEFRISDIAARENMWFHVDAAYGGFFAMCPEVPFKTAFFFEKQMHFWPIFFSFVTDKRQILWN